MRSGFLFGIVLSALIPIATWSAPPGQVTETAAASTRWIDVSSYVAANRLLGFVSNQGNIFYDASKMFGRNDGLYFPFTSVTDITGGTNSKTVVFDAGIWLGGQVSGQTRVSVAEYSTEFTPGPMLNGTFQPDYSGFKVYRLYRDSMAANPNYDYLHWPADQGAPVDGAGKPFLLGDQMLWSVYNDADASRHYNNAGRTLPLGVEIQQTVWAYHSADPNTQNAVYVKYKLYNRGANQIDNFHVSFWADPDVGNPATDLVGCDTVTSIFFAYKGVPIDTKYGARPPSWGGKLLAGLVTPSIGDTASFDGHPLPNYRNLPMTSFDKYINGTDPHSPTESFNYMQGLNADGSPHMFDGHQSHYFCSGDPIGASGDLDSTPADKRLMMNCGAVTFFPGDSQQMVFKFAAAQGTDRLSSLTLLKHYLNDSYVPTGCQQTTALVSDFGHLQSVRFEPATQQWLTGIKFGAYYFGGGAGTGLQFFGSALNPAISPDSFATVEIRFSKVLKQKAYRYLRPGYSYAGYRDVPFTAWDVDRNLQLNVAFVEDPGSRTLDSTWDIDDTAHYGGREYLFIFRSPYSGADPMNSSIKYPLKNLKNDAATLDVLYGGWFALKDGHAMSELNDGQTIVFEAQSIGRNGAVEQLEFRPVDTGKSSLRSLTLECSSSIGVPAFSFESSDPALFSVDEDTIPFDTTVSRGLRSIREIASASGPVEPPDGHDVMLKPNSTGDWLVTNPSGTAAGFAFNPSDTPKDWEIRFTAQGSNGYDRYGYAKLPYRVPFELWDIGAGTPDNSSDDFRANILMVDMDGNGAFSYGDRIYFLDQPYEEGGPDTLTGVISSNMPLRIFFDQVAGTGTAPGTGTVIRLISAHNQLTARAPMPSPEPDFVARYGASDPTGVNDEAARNLILSFKPTSAGNHSGWLYVIDSLNGTRVASIALSGRGIGNCCIGQTGNVDGLGAIDLVDLTYLISYLVGGVPITGLPCPQAANINGVGIIDLPDLAALVNYLVGEGYVFPSCP